MAAMVRISKLKYEDLSGELQEALQSTHNYLGFVPNSLLTLSRKPRIALAAIQLNRAIQESISFPRELRRMMFHIESLAAGCQYCQAHSISGLSRSTGISPEKLKDLWYFETSELFSDAERAALRFAQACAVVPNAVTDRHFEDLKKYYSDDQIVEMLAVLSFGAWLNRFNDTLGTALEEDAAGIAEKVIGPKGWSAGKHASTAD